MWLCIVCVPPDVSFKRVTLELSNIEHRTHHIWCVLWWGLKRSKQCEHIPWTWATHRTHHIWCVSWWDSTWLHSATKQWKLIFGQVHKITIRVSYLLHSLAVHGLRAEMICAVLYASALCVMMTGVGMGAGEVGILPILSPTSLNTFTIVFQFQHAFGMHIICINSGVSGMWNPPISFSKSFAWRIMHIRTNSPPCGKIELIFSLPIDSWHVITVHPPYRSHVVRCPPHSP